MVTKYLQTVNLNFDQVMFNSLVLMFERNFEVRFGIFSVLVFQISVLERSSDIYHLAFVDNKSTILLFYSIFRTTPEVSSKLYFVEIR